MSEYNPKDIESKWQKKWADDKTFATPEDATKDNKFYILPQLPYPSGSGLHVGHAEVYTACDIMARYRRMKGNKVMQVIGWDSFGLPAENYAIKTNVHPRISTEKAIDNFRSQIKSLGISVDWDRETGSHNPDYYKWTQWFFLLMYKRGLAYREMQSVNWCDDCKTVLANEQVVEGKCERCGHSILQKDMEQWYLRITEYADRLINDLDGLDWPEETKKRQKDWIGRSEGASIEFSLKDADQKIEVFTTRPDTLFGATYMVLAPEHDLVHQLEGKIENLDEVKAYVEATAKKSELDRQIDQEKTGVELKGVKAINPANNEELPIWIADYVLASYGTGAIMAVPAHDERDYEFAKKFELEIKPVYIPSTEKTKEQKETIETYNKNADAYLERTPSDMTGEWKEFFDGFFSGVSKEASVFEFGSGTGRDASYVESLGYSVTRSDVPESFIDMMKKDGHDALKFDLLADGLAYQKYDVLLASAVFVHFTTEQLKNVLKKLNLNLKDSGSLLFTVKDKEDKGKESEVSDEKLDAPRFFSYWTKEEITKISEDAGFKIESISKPEGSHWIQIVARKNEDQFTTFSEGEVINSDFLNGMQKDEAVTKMIAWLEEKEIGKGKVQYKLRDWSVSRQRFWGAPIPMLYDEKGELQPVPEKDLPVILPDDVDFKPTGQSPLTYSESFNAGVEEKYGKGWKREADTLDTFMCSSWYFFRYLDPKNDEAFASPEQLKKWMPIDFYLGGEEHVNGHLLYARFFTKVLFDEGLIDFNEPFTVNRHQGLILGPDQRKMSKRWGNVVNPTDVVNEFGADTCRMYEMFMGPLEETKPWDTNGVKGVRRFLDRVWRLQEKMGDTASTEKLMHQTIKKVTYDLDNMQYNTAIAKMMELSNALQKQETVAKEDLQTFALLLSPFAPHMAEELWEALGNKETIVFAEWPNYDEAKIVEDEMDLVVQVNGKVRAKITVASDISEDDAKEVALADENVQKWLDGNEPKKVIYVKGKLISVVV
jgi:leucyl-tRNA synthetase